VLLVTNDSSATIEVAVAYRDPLARWTSQGWWRIGPFEEAAVFDAQPGQHADLHVYVRRSSGTAVSTRQPAGRRFRVRDDAFTIRDADRRLKTDSPVFEPLTAGQPSTSTREPFRHRVLMPEMADAEAALTDMVGLESVKELVLRRRAWMQVQLKRRLNADLRPAPIRLHMAFTGKPGTGKTTVARIFGDIYKGLGLLDSGHLVEMDGRGLIAGFVGQTAARTNEVIQSALDGVLFIDEAYALYQRDTPQDFGREAIATLIKGMEDNKDRLAVILAGYPDEIEELLSSNRGLRSRIHAVIDFPDYSPADLFRIFESLIDDVGARLTAECEQLLQRILVKLCERRDPHFGNARLVETLFQDMDEARSSRVVSGGLDYITAAFQQEDVPPRYRSLLVAKNGDGPIRLPSNTSPLQPSGDQAGERRYPQCPALPDADLAVDM
jgi:ATPase family associated with various cellular activities (AAA)/Protein of unknown function (DUF1036)/AAA lid domain